jgi:chromosome segregation ATPase
MTSSFTSRMTFSVLCTLLALAGCHDVGKEQALADAKTAKAALTDTQARLDNVKAQLEAAQKERDGLKTSVANLAAAVTSLKAELAAAAENRDQVQQAIKEIPALKDRVTQLARDRDAALATVGDAESMAQNLQGQVQELGQKLALLQEQNAKLQSALDEMQKKISETKVPGLPVP